MKTKSQCEVSHAKKRALERFGTRLNRESYYTIVKAIQSGKANFVKRQSNRVSVFDVAHAGQIMRAVYDSNRKKIVTFLKP